MFEPLVISAAPNPDSVRAFTQALGELKDTKLKKVGKTLMQLTGNWLYLCPGTKPEAPGTNHHTGDGGLVRHLLGVRRYALALANASGKKLEYELLAFTAQFHDIGKCFEFAENNGTTYTGLGHVGIGLMLIPRLLEEAGCSKFVIFAVSHMLASHHGHFDQGALIEPKTPEACILASADRLDARLWQLSHGAES